MAKLLCVSYDPNFIGFDPAMQSMHQATFQLLQEGWSISSALPEPAIARRISEVRPEICFVDQDLCHLVSRPGVLRGINYSPLLCVVGGLGTHLSQNDFDLAFLPKGNLASYVDSLLCNPVDMSMLKGFIEFNPRHYRSCPGYEHRLEKPQMRGPVVVSR